MTPLEAAAIAIVNYTRSTKAIDRVNYDGHARAAVRAYLQACAADEMIASRVAEAADDEMALQTKHQTYSRMNVGRAAIAALCPPQI